MTQRQPPGEAPFGAVLRQYRVAAAISQEDLAARAGLGVRTVSDIERGVSRAPHPATVARLAEGLGLSPAERATFALAAQRKARSVMTAPEGTASTSTPPQALPAFLTPLVGREHEEAMTLQLLQREGTRLLTLTGPAGVGKTRLAIQVGRGMPMTVAEMVVFVPLASVTDPIHVADAIALALRLRPAGSQPMLDLLIAWLRTRSVLLVLDNFEHLLPAAPQLADILVACPDVRVLVTSRARLHVRGERELIVSPLSVPAPDREVSSEDQGRYAAIALFTQRARAVNPSFDRDASLAPVVAEICRSLDGLPLAIELAAARIKLLPPRALLVRLRQRLDVLADGPRDLPTRQRTLENAIGWSYDLLTVGEQRLFRWLAVFTGGWTLDAAEAVCGTSGKNSYQTPEVIGGLTALVDQSLVDHADAPDGEPRFRMLTTLRAFASERLAASGEQADARRHHARYFVSLADQAEGELAGPDQGPWAERLERERDNIRDALAWACASEEADEVVCGLRLCGALRLFWYLSGRVREGRTWVERLLALADDATPADVRAKALNCAGYLAFREGVVAAARQHCQEAADLCERIGDRPGMAMALNYLGTTAVTEGAYDRARALFEEVLAIQEELHDRLGYATALNNLAVVALRASDPVRAAQLFERALPLSRQLGAPSFIATCLDNLGDAYERVGDFARAEPLIREGLAMRRAMNDQPGIAMSLRLLGHFLRQRGRLAAAEAALREALVLSATVGAMDYLVRSLEDLAVVVRLPGDPARAARMRGLADAIRERNDLAVIAADLSEYRAENDALRSALGEDAFAAAWAEGRQQTIEAMLAELDHAPVPSPAPAPK